MNSKITDYCVLHKGNIGSLVNATLSALNEGWQPIGGVSYVQLSNGTDQYCQALVKYTEPRPKNEIPEGYGPF